MVRRLCSYLGSQSIHADQSKLEPNMQGHSDLTVSLASAFNFDQLLPPPKTSVMMKAVDVAQR